MGGSLARLVAAVAPFMVAAALVTVLFGADLTRRPAVLDSVSPSSAPAKDPPRKSKEANYDPWELVPT